MYKIKISPQVDLDVENIVAYIALDNPYRAVSFVNELLFHAKSMLSSFPSLGKKEFGCRVLVCKGYFIFYKINEKKKEILLLRIINPANYNAYKNLIN